MAAIAIAFAALAASAATATAGPVWELTSLHGPGDFQPGGIGEYTFLVTNVGDATATGPVSIEVSLPAGVSTRSHWSYQTSGETWFAGSIPSWRCGAPPAGRSAIGCTALPAAVAPGVQGLGRLTVYVAVAPDARGTLPAVATVTGGGAETVTKAETATVGAPATRFGLAPGTLEVQAYDRLGRPERQAGAHPARWTAAFGFNQRVAPEYNPQGPPATLPSVVPIGTMRNLEIALPRGFVGDPRAAAICAAYELAASSCPPTSQVGTVQALVQSLNGPGDPTTLVEATLHNLQPREGVAGSLGFSVLGRPVVMELGLHPRDHSLVARVRNVNETLPVHHVRLTIWGVPSDPMHDQERGNPRTGGWDAPFGGSPAAFATLPSECDVPGVVDVALTSWQGDPVQRHSTVTEPLRGCERQRFDASARAAPDTTQVDAPTGLVLGLDIPLATAVVGLGTPPLREAVVRLPEGMAISPAAAAGLETCAPAQIALGSDAAATCPDASKVGTVAIATPLLADPLAGSVYLARQGDNPFTSMLAVYLAVEGPGILIKLPGRIDADPSTGRLTATFEDLPPLPLARLELRFNGGPRGLLATPEACGTTTTTAQLTPWNATLPSVPASSAFEASHDGAGGACPPARPFDPSFEAGTVNPVAGTSSPFTLTLGRADRQQHLRSISTRLPPGLTARLASATLCPDAAANAGTCPADSRIGAATIAAGPGASPFWLSGGRVDLTRSYKGGAYGIAIAMRALAGPFDLGEVVVRGAIHLDPVTAAVTIETDPLPSILGGIPLRVRTVNVTLDRPGFIVNPTSCAPAGITARIGSTEGAVADRRVRFQVGDCAALPFAPRTRLTVGRRGHTRRNATTPLTATLTQPPGQGNPKSLTVALPTTLNARLGIVSQACPADTFARGACGARGVIGSAVVVTPLLRDPLRSRVHLVDSDVRSLPDVVLAVRGPVSIDVTGRVTVAGGRLAIRFDAIPDIPLTRVTIRFADGRRGAIGAVRDLCTPAARRATARIELGSHSGRRLRVDRRLQVVGCVRPRARTHTGRSGTRVASMVQSHAPRKRPQTP